MIPSLRFGCSVIESDSYIFRQKMYLKMAYFPALIDTSIESRAAEPESGAPEPVIFGGAGAAFKI